MKAKFISDDKRALYTRFLNTKDYERVAVMSGYSFSTVNNILNQRTRVNSENVDVVRAFDEVCKERIEETKDVIEKAEGERLLSSEPYLSEEHE